MTQAPTPGPPDWTAHDGSDVPIFNTYVDVVKRDGSEWANIHSGQWGQDWLWSDDDTTKADIVSWRPVSLAPTAPVEASGSEREAITHEVKCWREPFAVVKSGAKPWELRLNDRDYRVGDTLRQFEWNEAENCYTGDEVSHRIGWALHGPAFGLPKGHVIMTLEDLRAQPSGETRALIGRLSKSLADATRLPGINFTPDVSVDDLRAILALLSARPLALGGQHSGGEKSVMVCPQCEGEGEYADGVDEAACSTPCTRCDGNGWLVDLAALSTTPARAEAQDEGAAGEIKPCPFCGAGAQACKNDHDDPVWSVECDECPASLTSDRFNRDTAIAAWNARSHPSPTPAADADRVLVPLEPTSEMHAAGVAVTEKKLAPSWTALEVYRAMTRAALKSTAAKEGGVV